MPLIRRSLIARLLARRAWRLMAGLFGLIVAIFMTDIFTSELEAVIRNGGHFGDFLWLMLLKVPGVVDFALPIVLFLGLFFAIQGARTENELMIAAAAGEPWHRVPRTALLFGLGAMLLSVTFSGLVVPWASYTLRLSFHDLVARQFVTQLTTPQDRQTLTEVGGRVVIAVPTKGTDRGRLFIYTGVPDDPDVWRAALARDWTIEGPEDGDTYRLHVEGFREIQGRGAEGTSRAPGVVAAPALELSRLTVGTLDLDFQLSDVLGQADRSQQSSERFLFQAGGPLEAATIGTVGPPAPSRALGEMLARALLTLVAAAMAVATASFAGARGGRWLALPLGLVAVMAADIGSRAILGDAAGLGFTRFWIAALALTALGLAPALGYVWLRGEALVTPPRTERAR